MRVTVLASGSGGNATLIQAGGTRVLVDAGVGPRVIEERMQRALGRTLAIDGIIATHPHGDHVGKLGPCARHFSTPVYFTAATERRLRLPRGVRTVTFGRDTPFGLGSIKVEPFPIPHDAPQVGLTFQQGWAKAALLTDLGHVPTGIPDRLVGCQAVLLESNHDATLLWASDYPEFLKRRIFSRHGHLENRQSAALLAKLGSELRDVVLMHVSRQCNRPLLALRSARAALKGRGVRVRLAEQDVPLDLSVRWAASPRSRVSEAQLALPI